MGIGHGGESDEAASSSSAAAGLPSHTTVLAATRQVVSEMAAGRRFVEVDILAEVFDALELTYEQQSEQTARMVSFALSDLADAEGLLAELPHHERLAWLHEHRPQLPTRTAVWARPS